MYKLAENSYNKCSVEFSFLTTKKRKVQFLKTVLSVFFDEQTSIVGEINGLDFSINKLSEQLETKSLIISSEQNEYMTLTFSSSEVRDFSTILSNFDNWSEGYYVIYILPRIKFKLNESLIPLIDHQLDNFLLKFSVHSDSTLFDFEFKEESAYNKFIKLMR